MSSRPTIVTLPVLGPERRGWGFASTAIGVGVSAAIFLGLAFVQRQKVDPLPMVVDDVHAVALPVQPPPPAPQTDDVVPVFDQAAIQLAASASPDSTVKLPAAPIPTDVVPPARSIPRFDLTPGAVKPAADVVERDVNHIYNRSEVDQKPVAIFRKVPELNRAQIKSMKVQRIGFLMVAAIDGKPSNITVVESTGSKEVDQICVEALREWRFRPAIKKGRQVRCWVQQNLIFQVSSFSPFEAHAP